MSSNRFFIICALTLVSLLTLSASVFRVDQRQMAIVFQLGEAVREIKEPGLSFKIPFIQNVVFYDNRFLNIIVEAKELTTANKKRIIVDAFAKYKIEDPLTFFKTLQGTRGVSVRVNKILDSTIRNVIGRVPLDALLSEQRGELMNKIRDQVAAEAKDFGIKITDVRILKTNLHEDNSEAIFSRMITERKKEAQLTRAEGNEEARRTTSRADKERRIILAKAYKQGETIRGKGDAEAAKIYNQAFGKDEDFFNFYRSLSVYTETLNKENTSFILSPNSEFFKHLKLKNK